MCIKVDPNGKIDIENKKEIMNIHREVQRLDSFGRKEIRKEQNERNDHIYIDVPEQERRKQIKHHFVSKGPEWSDEPVTGHVKKILQHYLPVEIIIHFIGPGKCIFGQASI